MFRSTRRSGFTLIELLVVIAIIGIMMSMLFPAVQQVREAANRMACANKVRQFGLAAMNYESAHKKLPPGAVFHQGTGWHYFIMDYIELNTVYKTMDVSDGLYSSAGELDDTFNDTTNYPNNVAAVSTYYDIFRCPSDPTPENISSSSIDERVPCSYLAVASGNAVDDWELEYDDGFSYPDPDEVRALRSGVMAPTEVILPDPSDPTMALNSAVLTRTRIRDIQDGTSHTLMFGECIFFNADGGGTFLAFDHWYVGSPNNDGTSCADESEFLGSTAAPFNYFHRFQDLSVITSSSSDEYQFLELSFGSWHAGDGLNFCKADGSTQFVAAFLDDVLRQNLGMKADGNYASLE